jgi:hypothetical protein
MRRLLLRFSVALVAFFVGITTATVFAAIFGIGASRESTRPVYLPTRTYGCKSQRFMREQPPPPAPQTMKPSRFIIHNQDGTIRVIESETGTQAPARR